MVSRVVVASGNSTIPHYAYVSSSNCSSRNSVEVDPRVTPHHHLECFHQLRHHRTNLEEHHHVSPLRPVHRYHGDVFLLLRPYLCSSVGVRVCIRVIFHERVIQLALEHHVPSVELVKSVDENSPSYHEKSVMDCSKSLRTTISGLDRVVTQMLITPSTLPTAAAPYGA